MFLFFPPSPFHRRLRSFITVHQRSVGLTVFTNFRPSLFLPGRWSLLVFHFFFPFFPLFFYPFFSLFSFSFFFFFTFPKSFPILSLSRSPPFYSFYPPFLFSLCTARLLLFNFLNAADVVTTPFPNFATCAFDVAIDFTYVDAHPFSIALRSHSPLPKKGTRINRRRK